MTGPLAGLRVVEFAGIGPGPFAGMMLADHGADVVRIERAVPAGLGALIDPGFDVPGRGRRRVALDLKVEAGRAAALALIRHADVLIEGNRPGVMERLGLGPEAVQAANPALVYARVTGWGREGPLAARAGHDLNYLALSGALWGMGEAGRPPLPPLNLVADYGGGGMLLAFGILAAVLAARASGRGTVVDAAMVDGAALQSALFHGLAAAGQWREERGGNLLDGSAPFYRCYVCADGGFVAVGALEPAFYAALLAGLALADDPRCRAQYDRDAWPKMAEAFAAAFASRTRDVWAELFAQTDACVTPVLTLAEAAAHPHAAARGAFPVSGGFQQPAPAPRFGGEPAAVPAPGARAELAAILADWARR